MKIAKVKIEKLKPAKYNPRKWSEKAIDDLKESIKRFGMVDPLITNSAPGRKNIVIGGHFRLKVAKDLGYKEVPVVYVDIPDIKKEKELNLRLNRNLGSWDKELLANFDAGLLEGVGFESQEIDNIFQVDLDQHEVFDLKKELEKLNIQRVSVKEGDVFQLGNHRLMCGSSVKEDNIKKLMGEEKADMCFTDPPYKISYLKGGKRHGKTVKGFGYKKDRQYLKTNEAPKFQDWMVNIDKIAKENFNIIIYENWKNVRELWNEMEKHWKIKNMIIWHLENRHQGFARKYGFFSRYDIAMLGSTKDKIEFNLKDEGELENEYQIALYAIKGKPYWEGYRTVWRSRIDTYCRGENEKEMLCNGISTGLL